MSSEDGLERTCSTEPIEPRKEEARVLPEPIGEGTSEGATLAGKEARVLPMPTGKGTSETATVIISEPVIIILQELPIVITRPLGPPLP